MVSFLPLSSPRRDSVKGLVPALLWPLTAALLPLALLLLPFARGTVAESASATASPRDWAWAAALAFLKVVVLGATSSRNSRLSRRDMALAANACQKPWYIALFGWGKDRRGKKKKGGRKGSDLKGLESTYRRPCTECCVWVCVQVLPGHELLR
jgi:hypothetical protein